MLGKELESQSVLFNAMAPGGGRTDVSPAALTMGMEAIPIAIWPASLLTCGPTGCFTGQFKRYPGLPNLLVRDVLCPEPKQGLRSPYRTVQSGHLRMLNAAGDGILSCIGCCSIRADARVVSGLRENHARVAPNSPFCVSGLPESGGASRMGINIT